MPEDDAIRCDACPVLCYIKPGRTGACDRYGNDNGTTGSDRSARSAGPRRDSRRLGCSFSRSRPGMGWQHRERPGKLRHRHRRGHDLSRLQACSVHHFLGGAGRGHGHGRHRRHLQLLRRQSEDRHRPPSRAGDEHGTGARRARRPRHHQRIWIADAFARRRPSPDWRQSPGGHGDLRSPAESVQSQARGAHDR